MPAAAMLTLAAIPATATFAAPAFAVPAFVAQVFVSSLWQGGLLLLAVSLCLHLLGRLGPAVRFAVWATAFVLLLAIPFLPLRPAAAGQSSSAPAIFHVVPAWAFAIAALWAALSLFRAIQLVLQAIRVRRIWKRAQPIADPRATSTLPSTPARAAQLCTSPDIDSPAVIGFFRPRLLLPESLLATLTPQQLHHIVLHECEHLRRYDDWVNLLQKLALVAFPLNPALFWIDRRLGLERELACDARVVGSIADRFRYADSLTHLAEHRLRSRPLALALSAWGRRSELARRIHTLLRPDHSLTRSQSAATALLLTLGLAACAVKMARVPQIIAFTATAPATSLAATPALPAAHALPVLYRPALPPHAMLLKAVMPAPRSPRHLTANQPLRRAFERTHLHRNPPSTTHSISIVYTSYAAVPFGDGWLVFEL